MNDTSRVAIDLVEDRDTREPGGRWSIGESLPFLAIVAMMLVGGVALHGWMGRDLVIEDENDAARIGMAMLGVDLAVALGLVGVGVLALVLDRRRRRLTSALAKAQRALTRQVEQDLEHRRLSLLGTLAAGLAHELGQPLSAARVGIEGIHYLRQLGREPTPEHLERTLSRVGMSLMAMTQTIDHLRSLAIPQGSTETGPVDLTACVDAVLADREHWLRFSDVVIDWRSPAAPIMVQAHPAGVRLILVNLLRNAVEAVAAQGADRRLVRVVAGPGPILTVHDSGPGIAPDRLQAVFDPFQSTKPGGGRGVGLSLALASARRMGADLEVVSDLGTGTVFTVRFIGRQDAP